MIQLSDLTKLLRRARPARRRHVAVGDGDRVGLCGPNGAGKTTLLRMLAGLDEPDRARSSNRRPHGRLSAAGRPGTRRTHAFRGSLARVPATARDESRDPPHRARAGRSGAARWRARDVARPLSRPAGSLPPEEGHSIELAATSPRRPRASRRDDFERSRRTRFRAAGRCASRSPSCCSAARPCSSSTSPRTTSISTRATGSRSYLLEYPHAVILVSHDRFFLDAVVTRIADLSLRTMTDYLGTYIAVSRRARRAHGAAAQGEARAGRGGRADASVHRPVPLSGHQGRAGAEPDQDARQGRADRSAGRNARRVHFTFPAVPEERPHGARDRRTRARRTATLVVLDGHQPAHRARRPHCARRAERRRQVHADAHAVRRRSARSRHARRRPQGRDAVLRAGRSHAPRPEPHGLRDAGLRIAARHGADDSQHPGRLPVLRRRHLQAGPASSRAASGRGSPWRACCCARPTRCCSTSRRTISTSIRRTCCSMRSSDYGGTLIFVSHDRYFVDRLATKIIEVGGGHADRLPRHLRGVSLAQGTRRPDDC